MLYMLLLHCLYENVVNTNMSIFFFLSRSWSVGRKWPKMATNEASFNASFPLRHSSTIRTCLSEICEANAGELVLVRILFSPYSESRI